MLFRAVVYVRCGVLAVAFEHLDRCEPARFDLSISIAASGGIERAADLLPIMRKRLETELRHLRESQLL